MIHYTMLALYKSVSNEYIYSPQRQSTNQINSACKYKIEKRKKQMYNNKYNKNSSGDEIANVNFYALCPEATRIR